MEYEARMVVIPPRTREVNEIFMTNLLERNFTD
jgi:hypothetical protein